MILSKYHQQMLLSHPAVLTLYACLKRLQIQPYMYLLLRAGHPNNIKRGGVFIYLTESLPLIRRNDLTNLKDCLVTQINVNNEKCFLTCLYRSHSQSHDELKHFCTTFDLLLSNINNLYLTCSIVLGNFNAKC